ncbi:zinc ABC transporter substrate-binding protein [Kiloniella laminariae]|uniref:High-affinity zinc uptake system protein ZnuA n=1 Tax=Kiloniella laminariae TaxID=454162 RepID=A0ABT4LP03_9PROT|nr:zinc ABC transporter substrate-binding protein [Kiloniella laminariae]MCZ4282812.1 zinc ABC transporter substrate-binding protein [Kiloniella laminariae]
MSCFVRLTPDTLLRLLPKKSLSVLFALPLGLFMTGSALADEAPRVAVSILPIHALVQSVMEGVGEPELLIDQGASPHGYSLRPSQVRALNSADLVVWVGEGLETFLVKSLHQKSENGGTGAALELMDIAGLTLLENRTAGAWKTGEDHDHGEKEGDGHTEQAEEDQDHTHDHGDNPDHGPDHSHGHEGHNHEEHNDEVHHHEEDHDHNHGKYDPHIWLSLDNASVIVARVGEELARIDPAHAEIYAANVSKTQTSLAMLKQDIAGQLLPVSSKPYLVFHDAYQYFELDFDLNVIGAVTIDPDRKPGAKRLSELRHLLEESGAVCVFREPQFQPAVIEVLSENLAVQIGELDPLGANLEKGADAYPRLLEGLANSLTGCLSKK